VHNWQLMRVVDMLRIMTRRDSKDGTKTITNHSKIEASNLAVATNMKQTSWFPIEYIYVIYPLGGSLPKVLGNLRRFFHNGPS